MIVKADLSALKSVKPHEYAIRFFFGGLITALAGLIASRFGPSVGGLFLAFPAIFPASVTLIEKHEKKAKQKIGHDGTVRGRSAAALEALGCLLGAFSLILYAFIIFRFLPAHSPWLVLPSAALAWFLLASLLWFFYKRIH